MSNKRLLPACEAILVVALFWYFRLVLKDAGFGDWQRSLFGAALVSSLLLYFVLPLAFVLLGRRDPGSCGLTTEDLGYHRSAAWRGLMFIAPATTLFPVIGLLGSSHEEWLGATILTVGFIVAGIVFASMSRDLRNMPDAKLSWRGLPVYLALLVFALFASALLHPISETAAELIRVLIFVGFLEEFLFRGYAQARFNETFGRPLQFRGVKFGAGLLITAVIFGLFHPLTVESDPPWAWGMWTAAFGLALGYIREKTGAVVVPATLHGIMWIPGVFFGPG